MIRIRELKSEQSVSKSENTNCSLKTGHMIYILVSIIAILLKFECDRV